MKILKSKTSLNIILLLLMSYAGYAQNKLPIKSDQVLLELDRKVRTGKLPNGFTYFLRHNESPKNRVYMYLVNKVGSVLEDEDQRGLAHFMEHMNFNGTAHFPHNDLVDYLQKAGVRFGADINAYTSFDETVYQLPIPSDKPEILNRGLLIMHDWAQSALLDPDEIDKERGVILEEKRLAKGAGERMQRAYFPMLFNNARYANRLPIGQDTVLNNFKKPALTRFYRDWYRPDLQALIVVGDVNVDSLEKVIKSQFSDLKNPAHERPRVKYTVPLTGKNQFLTVTDKEMTGTKVQMIFKHLKQSMKSEADYKNSIIQNLFNLMLYDRYAEIGRQATPPFIGASASIGAFASGIDAFNANVNAKEGQIEPAVKALWREIVRLEQFGFTVTEFERAKKETLNGAELAVKEIDKRSSLAFTREYQEYFLNDIASPGMQKELELTRKDLSAITLENVNGLTKKYIGHNNRDLLVLAPEKNRSGLPDEKTLNSWLNSVENEKLMPYHDDVSNLPLLSKLGKPGSITKIEKDEHLKITKLTLSNGVKVILKSTNFKDNEILFSAFAPGGTSLSSDADYQSALNATLLLSAGGLGNYNQTELNKYLSDKESGTYTYVSERSEGINGSTTPKDIETALKLVYGGFTAVRIDTSAVKGILNRSRASFANRGDNPKTVFSDTINAVMGKYNIRRTNATLEKLEQIDLNKSYAFYKGRFNDASNFTFIFVGNIDTTKLYPLLNKYVASLPATHKHETAKDLGIQLPEGKITKVVKKGSEAQAQVQLVYSGKFDYSTANTIELDALKETLEIRLLERLREEESGVYSPTVSQSIIKLPQSSFTFTIQFGCAPGNADKLIASTIDEINKIKVDGPPQQNIEKWRAEVNSVSETSLKTNNFWIAYFLRQIQNGDDLNDFKNYAAMRDKVNSDSLKIAAKKYLTGDNFMKFILLPERNPTAKIN